MLPRRLDQRLIICSSLVAAPRIAESVHPPEVARALDSIGRETRRAALREIMARAQAASLLRGRPEGLAEQFGGLLLGDLMISLLLGVAQRPSPRQVTERP
jgi:hypothetical protein